MKDLLIFHLYSATVIYIYIRSDTEF